MQSVDDLTFSWWSGRLSVFKVVSQKGQDWYVSDVECCCLPAGENVGVYFGDVFFLFLGLAV